VAKEKLDAEEEGSQSTFRRLGNYKKRSLAMMAREEGRKTGFTKKVLSQGRRIGFEEGRSVRLAEDEPRTDDDGGDDADEEPIQIRPA